MFKKSLLAVAVLGTAAGFACAADVTLYGKLDQGLVFTHEKVQKTGVATTKTNTFAQESGVNSGNRWGLMGKEDLGNGLKVGFKLESGFNGDDGQLADGGRLFHREAALSLYGDFGTLSAGRMGGVGSGSGTYSLWTGIATAFDGECNDIGQLVTTSRYDNMLTYQTPKFAGVQATFQYSFAGDNTKVGDADREGAASVDRYASVGLTGEFGALQTVLTYEMLNYKSNDAGVRNADIENGQLISVGGNYDCGFAKTFVGAQYLKDMKHEGKLYNVDYTDDAYKEGYVVTVGAQVPVASGKLTTAVFYNDLDRKFVADATAKTKDSTSKYLGLGVKYEYPLSKRTTLYTGGGVGQQKVDYKNVTKEEKTTTYQAFAGLTHAF